MVKQAEPGAYRVWLEDEVHQSRHTLPGKVRQRIRKLINGLNSQPRPSTSKQLDTTSLAVPGAVEMRRLRLENWRIIYAVNDTEKWVWVLAIRQRPPYDYEDLTDFVSRLTE
jgi:mRNA-degrading endonuclease RelE of RelBE toxin-antitoxin system